MNKENCAAPEPVQITSNSPVVVGWPLYLNAPDRSYLYHWKGPNGYDKKYSYYSSDASGQIRENLQLADAGEYTLEMLDEQGCPAYKGVITVAVINPPSQPCNMSPNTGSSNYVGVGNGTNYSVSVIGTHVEGNLPGQSINLNFPGTTIRPGVYKSSGYWPTDDETAGLVISLFPYDFISEHDQLIYVTKNNSGKYEFGFCNHVFSNPLGGTPVKASVRLVQQ